MYNRARNILPGIHVGQWNLKSHLRMFNKNKLEYFRRMFSFFCFVLFIQISFPQSYFSIHKGTVTAFKRFKIFNNLLVLPYIFVLRSLVSFKHRSFFHILAVKKPRMIWGQFSFNRLAIVPWIYRSISSYSATLSCLPSQIFIHWSSMLCFVVKFPIQDIYFKKRKKKGSKAVLITGVTKNKIK